MSEDLGIEAKLAEITHALADARKSVAAMSDDLDKVKLIGEVLGKLSELTSECARARRELLEGMLYKGKTQSELARALGLSTARMSRLIKSGPPPERAFLGDGRLTVVVGEKTVNGNHNVEGPGVALETLGAYDRLKELAAAYKLDAEREVVPPPGLFDLNRSNLVVMSGPRLFPLVGQILAGDPNIRFECDPNGEWVLHDAQTGKSYATIERTANGLRRDFGYLGRLPRPDDKGTFLCFAGIHASGTQGVVAYLEQNLPHLYDEVKARRFSMVVECEYDPETRRVTTAKPASPIYKRS